MKQHDIEAYTESMFAGVVVDYSEENERLRTALEQIRALQPTEPKRMEDGLVWAHQYYPALGRWEAAQIADAALAPLLEHSPMPGEGDRDADEGNEAGGV